MKKLTVCFVTTGLGIGGAEKQICDLANQMSELGHTIHIISITGDTKLAPERITGKIYEIKMSKSPADIVKCIIRVSSILKDIGPDIVHSHMYHANVISRLACLIIGKTKKLICTAHNKNEGGKFRMYAYKITDRLCRWTTNVSCEALNEFIDKGAFKREKSSYVYNGIDENIYIPSVIERDKYRAIFNCDNETTLITVIGRLVEAKDHANFLKALSVLNANKKYKALIIGDGPLYQKTLDLIHELDLESNVSLLGFRQDIAAILNASDLFVLSSRWEGFGLVVAEAMLCERAVVATNSGGVSEVVNDDTQLVPINDYSELAKRMSYFLALENNKLNEIGKRNRKYIIDNFSLSKITNEWLFLYQQVLLEN